MVVIVITVIIQGPQVDPDARGEIKDYLFVNGGFFQAVGVISFGKSPYKSYLSSRANCKCSICLPYDLVSCLHRTV